MGKKNEKEQKPDDLKKPDDLDILFGTQEESVWLEVKEARILAIKNYEKALIIERAILELAESKLTDLK